jgi:hypothetical protein
MAFGQDVGRESRTLPPKSDVMRKPRNIIMGLLFLTKQNYA